MRTRSAGLNSFIQLHLELDGDISLMEAHTVSDAVMFQVERAFPSTEVLIHQDPAGIPERRDPFEG
jgi:ferrous-iron efflux pump FieF